jgi:hypothetical protein
MPRKPRRRPVHYITFAFRDGAVVGCLPTRKPSAKRLKEDGIRVDPDLVCREYLYGASNLQTWELEQRVRTGDLLTNRMNMRRTVRELVLPGLAEIREALLAIHGRLERIEQMVADGNGST